MVDIRQILAVINRDSDVNASINSLPTSLRTANSGFTLIELMVTISVLAIIVSIAAPSISTQLANQRVKSTAATLENALKEAKAESIIRRQDITVIYDNTAKPHTVTLRDSGSNDIAQYRIESQSSITQAITPKTTTSLVFQPNKLIEDEASAVYSICDDSTNNSFSKQIVVNRVANIVVSNIGSC